MMTLKEFIERSDKQVSEIFAATGKLMLMYHAVDGDKNNRVFLAPPVNDKDTAMAWVRSYLEEINATRVLAMVEAWVLDASDGDKEKVRAAKVYAETGETLEHAPGRAEAIVYMAEDEREGMLMASRTITRDRRGRPTLGPLVFRPQEGTQEGRMVGLLPRGRLQ